MARVCAILTYIRGVCPCWTSIIDRHSDSLQNVVWSFSGEDKCPITFLSAWSLSSNFFCNSRTWHSRSCGWLYAQDSGLHLTDKHSHLFLASWHSAGHWLTPACGVYWLAFSVERTIVPLLFCQCGHCPVIFFITLGHCIADPVTGSSPLIWVYIWPINTAIYF